MGKRKGLYVSHREYAECQPSPNEVVPAITVELRVHWPQNMGHEARVAAVVAAVAKEALGRLGYPDGAPQRPA